MVNVLGPELEWGFRGMFYNNDTLVAEFISPKKCTLLVVSWVILSQKV